VTGGIPLGTPVSIDRSRTSLGGPPLFATSVAAEGVTAIIVRVAAIRLQTAATRLSGRLSHKSGAPIRRSCGIQPAVLRPWVPEVRVAAPVACPANEPSRVSHVPRPARAVDRS
jgi:hypothetical protein